MTPTPLELILTLRCVTPNLLTATLQSVAALELEFRSTNLAGSANLDCGLRTQSSVARSLEPLSQFRAPRALVGQQCQNDQL